MMNLLTRANWKAFASTLGWGFTWAVPLNQRQIVLAFREPLVRFQTKSDSQSISKLNNELSRRASAE
jgi:hypothetical protein